MIYNIFKKIKKSEQKKNKLRIIVDTREKNSLIPALLIQNKIEIQFQTLSSGDYLIKDIIIERKTFSDFISSMINKRIFEQLKELLRYKKAILILEGYEGINELRGNLNPNSLRGFILSILTNYQIPIVFTKNQEETADYLVLLAKQQEKSKNELTLHSKIPKTLTEQKKYILEAFPEIGPVKAKKLLKRFKTLSKIFQASEEEIQPILKKKSKDFKKVLEN
jgi:Fanconi anemia group M protein